MTMRHSVLRGRGVITRRDALVIGAGALTTGFAGGATAQEEAERHGISAFGDLKYPPDFKHFDYVNPNAPKGGTLVLANPDRLTSFDKFNPFTQRGNPAPGIGRLFESLTTGSLD